MGHGGRRKWRDAELHQRRQRGLIQGDRQDTLIDEAQPERGGYMHTTHNPSGKIPKHNSSQ
jgi:hypothetical protein